MALPRDTSSPQEVAAAFGALGIDVLPRDVSSPRKLAALFNAHGLSVLPRDVSSDRGVMAAFAALTVDPYDALVLGTDDLRDYWPLDSRLGANLGAGTDWSESSGEPGWEAEDGYLYLPPGVALTVGNDLHLDARYDEWTLEAWIKPKAAPESQVVTWLMKDYYESPLDDEDLGSEGYYLLWGYNTDPDADTWVAGSVRWQHPPQAHSVDGPYTDPTQLGGGDRELSPYENAYPVDEWRYMALVVRQAGGLFSGSGYGASGDPVMATIYESDGTTDWTYGRGIPETDTLLESTDYGPVYLGTHPLEDPSLAPDMAIARMAFYTRALTPDEIAARASSALVD